MDDDDDDGSVESIQVNPGGLSDSPSVKDTVGFTPYVRALAWFLLSDKTRPPLTVSVEGQWGSGKSSFMLQLEKSIDDTAKAAKSRWRASTNGAAAPANPPPDVYCVRFNAWRSDKDEALWAAFALTFMRQLAQKISFWRRTKSNFQLLWGRIDWRAGKLQLAQLALFALTVIVLTVVLVSYPDLAKPSESPAASGLLGIAWLGAAGLAFKKVKDILGNPLSKDLGKLVRNPRYEDKLAFIERFQQDFAKIVQSYVGANGRIYIFIDDLDRCEVPRAADLMQAINLLLSADQANMFFILGIDRKMVAAGLAAKHEKILPYLAAGRLKPNGSSTARVGIEYGYSFLEKFIQVPFLVPTMQEDQIGKLVASLTGPAADETEKPNGGGASESTPFDLVAGADPAGFAKIISDIARVFDFNPRRLKQFVNVFRLRVMIALSTNVLARSGRSSSDSGDSGSISLAQLGLFTAVVLRWPQLVGDLVADPELLQRLSDDEDQEAEDSRWADEPELRAALTIGDDYSLLDVDLLPLLLVMPDTYGRGLGEAWNGPSRPTPADRPGESAADAPPSAAAAASARRRRFEQEEDDLGPGPQRRPSASSRASRAPRKKKQK